VGKANKASANAGIASPTDSSHRKQVEKMQMFPRSISEKKLQKNCREHALACRSLLAVCAIRLNGQTDRVIRTVRITIRTRTVAIPQ
jgi:hypothetical protein